MNLYLVSWNMVIEATSPVEAAQKALKIHRDQESIATVFEVRDDETGELIQVDLTEGTAEKIEE